MGDSFFIMLVIFAITGISSFLQKKAQAEQEKTSGGKGRDPNMIRPRPPAQPGQRPTPQPAQQKSTESESPPNLETQLRQWLQKGFVEESAPPPIRPEPVQAPPLVPVPTADVYPKAPPARESVLEHVAKLGSHLQESTRIDQRADDIHTNALEHLESGKPVPHHSSLARQHQKHLGTDEVASAISMMRSPGTVRQALIASFILAPPKGLEDL